MEDQTSHTEGFKRRGGRGRRPYRNRRGVDRRQELDSPWMHDLYGENPVYSRTNPRQISVSDANFCVKIENLHWNVTQEDLQELFSAVGMVSQIKIHFDRSGRSEGKASVYFVHEEDAKTAVEEYHGRQLDGLELSVMYDPQASKKGNILSRLGNRSLEARLGPSDGILSRLGEKSDFKKGQRKKVSMRREEDVVMEDTREQVSYADTV
jgi:RNA recognition motif-containing protein